MAVCFNDEQMQEIERLALLNCNSNTIAEAVGVAVSTLKRHCERKMRHWRALYRVNLRESQGKLSETSPDLVKFLGKNVLGQTDKQIIASETVVPKIKAEEAEAYEAAGEAFKLKRAMEET